MALTIGVDVGGTKIASGIVDEDGEILAQTRRTTPTRDASAASSVVVDSILELLALGAQRGLRAIEAVGIGAAGFVDDTRSTVAFAANLGWVNEPLAQKVSAAVNLPVVVENDANAAAWAEYRFGAGRSHLSVVCVTVGTGIGGGIVLDGGLVRGRYGMAAEFGHIRLVPEGRPCGCGRRGCWEQYASGNALVREARELAAERRPDATLLLSYGDGTPEGVVGPHITAAAQAGDPVAVEAFVRVGSWLGRGMAELAAVLDPSGFVIGGGVIDAGELLLGPARSVFAADLVGAGHRPTPAIVPAELGNGAGIAGAADLSRLR